METRPSWEEIKEKIDNPDKSLFDQITQSKIYKILWNLKVVIVLLMFYGTYIYSNIFEPHLEVTYSERKTHYPNKYMNQLNEIYGDSSQIYRLNDLFFGVGSTIIELNVENNYRKRVNDIDLKINGIRKVILVESYTTSNALNEYEGIDAIKMDEGTISLFRFNSLPAYSSIKFVLWCTPEYAYNRISLKSGADSDRVIKSFEVEGVWYVLYRYRNELIIAIIVLLIVRFFKKIRSNDLV